MYMYVVLQALHVHMYIHVSVLTSIATITCGLVDMPPNLQVFGIALPALMWEYCPMSSHLVVCAVMELLFLLPKASYTRLHVACG